MENNSLHKLGIDIGSTTVKIALLDADDNILFSDYERHFANIQETLESLIRKAYDKTGDLSVCLPHKLMIEIKSNNNEKDTDIIPVH